jgi:ABC-type Fe3+/spermidine/putrescine transport system ATPase subunit
MESFQLEVKNISKSYNGILALESVSFQITAAEKIAILGPSGCGKSTLLRLLAGLEAPTAGEVLFDGSVASKPERVLIEPHKRRIAMVFQDLALWPNLSVLENVILCLKNRSESRKELQARAYDALQMCSIAALAKRKPHEVSGGQQQRIALARAIAAQPDFLFLDEPFSGLDLILKSKLLKDIAEIAKSKNTTLILVTHDPLEATALCTKAVVLKEGRLEEKGNLNQLLQHPKCDFLRVFKEQLSKVW